MILRIFFCSKCGHELDRKNLNGNRKQSYCLSCHAAYMRANKPNRAKRSRQKKIWYAANRELVLARSALRYASDPLPIKACSAAWQKANPEMVKANCSAWAKNNKSRRTAARARRRATKLRSTPPWADQEAISCIYKESEYQQMDVDHIVPLVSNLVCGLHWELNLQLLNKRDNIIKSNRIWPDMP